MLSNKKKNFQTKAKKPQTSCFASHQEQVEPGQWKPDKQSLRSMPPSEGKTQVAGKLRETAIPPAGPGMAQCSSPSAAGASLTC